MQTCLYDFLDYRYDPLFNKIQHMETGREIVVDTYNITFNVFGRFELTSQNLHESFQNSYGLYQRLLGLINEKQFSTFR